MEVPSASWWLMDTTEGFAWSAGLKFTSGKNNLHDAT
jgi:hypothetical protein